MKRYKYQAMVTLLPEREQAAAVPLPGPACRMVVRARHHDTHAGKLFSALVTSGEETSPPGSSCVVVTMTVLGDDARDYLAPGDDFALWRGCDVGRGVVTRRVFV
jgi:hypothetical protein